MRYDNKITFSKDTKHFTGLAFKLLSGVWHFGFFLIDLQTPDALKHFATAARFCLPTVRRVGKVAALSYGFGLQIASVARCNG